MSLSHKNDLELITTKNVSRETMGLLETYAAQLLKWNNKINLVSKKITEDELWYRHILDSAQLVKHIPDDVKSIIDLGSGAGFPGIILSIIGNYEVVLVESDQRKCAFLLEISRILNLRTKILNCRIEDVKTFPVDMITSRALAPLTKLLEYSQRFLEKDNFMLFLKGQNVVEEIKEASICWKFLYTIFPDAHNSKENGVLKISNVRRL